MFFVEHHAVFGEEQPVLVLKRDVAMMSFLTDQIGNHRRHNRFAHAEGRDGVTTRP